MGQGSAVATSSCSWVKNSWTWGPKTHISASRGRGQGTEMHAQVNVALESPHPSPHSGALRLRAQGLPTPACPAFSARRARAPHLQVCLQPSSRLGLGSSLQVAWPRLQLPGWPQSWNSQDESVLTQAPGPRVPAWRVGRPRK